MGWRWNLWHLPPYDPCEEWGQDLSITAFLYALHIIHTCGQTAAQTASEAMHTVLAPLPYKEYKLEVRKAASQGPTSTSTGSSFALTGPDKFVDSCSGQGSTRHLNERERCGGPFQVFSFTKTVAVGYRCFRSNVHKSNN